MASAVMRKRKLEEAGDEATAADVARAVELGSREVHAVEFEAAPAYWHADAAERGAPGFLRVLLCVLLLLLLVGDAASSSKGTCARARAGSRRGREIYVSQTRARRRYLCVSTF